MKLKISILLIFILMVTAVAFAQARNAADVVAQVKKEFAPDTRVAVWTVKAGNERVATISGEVDNPRAKDALISRLEAEGITYRDKVKVLPDGSVAEKWAVVSISVACLRAEPRSGSELSSQAIMGTPMRVLKKENGMLMVQTPDGYIGYMTESSMRLMSDEEFEAWKVSPRVVVTVRETEMYATPKVDAKNIVSDLLLGNVLEQIGEKGGYYLVKTADSREGYVKKSDVEKFDVWADQSFDYAKIEANAFAMMGRPYLWGGMSSKMSDCSGFMRTIYFSNGIILQRDASQQALTGKKVNWKKWRSEAQKGDLIFIGTKAGKVTHVAMYIGDGKYIHSSGRIKVNSMDPEASDYLDYTFISMSRIQGEVGTQGIIAVKDHPWYFK